MRRLLLIITLVLASNLSFAARAQSGTETFTGEIMDAQCASVGSHKMMLKTTGTDDAKDCGARVSGP
jgi:hypothetical protein